MPSICPDITCCLLELFEFVNLQISPWDELDSSVVPLFLEEVHIEPEQRADRHARYSQAGTTEGINSGTTGITTAATHSTTSNSVSTGSGAMGTTSTVGDSTTTGSTYPGTPTTCSSLTKICKPLNSDI